MEVNTNNRIQKAMDSSGLDVRITIQGKGHEGIIKYSKEDKCYYGKIENIKDLILFEGQLIDEVVVSFIDAIEDYEELIEL